MCVCIAGGGGKSGGGCDCGLVDHSEGTVCRTGLAPANLSWREPRLGVLNFCMHDQWHWIKKKELEGGRGGSGMGGRVEQVGEMMRG